jgi:hypothetical protein
VLYHVIRLAFPRIAANGLYSVVEEHLRLALRDDKGPVKKAAISALDCYLSRLGQATQSAQPSSSEASTSTPTQSQPGPGKKNSPFVLILIAMAHDFEDVAEVGGRLLPLLVRATSDSSNDVKLAAVRVIKRISKRLPQVVPRWFDIILPALMARVRDRGSMPVKLGKYIKSQTWYSLN